MTQFSTLNEQDIALLASKRLKQGASAIPTLMTYIPNALNNLGREIANDPFRRRLLQSDRTAVQALVTSSGLSYYVDLSSLISSYGLMLEYMQLGTVFYTYTLIVKSVDTAADTLTLDDTSGFLNGDAVIFTTTGTLPGGMTANTAYYVLVQNSATIKLYSDPNDPTSIVNISSTFTGTVTLNLQNAGYGDSQTCQWQASAGAAEFDTGTTFPDYTYIWLIGNLMYTNRTLGTFSFTCPYLPLSLSVLPSQLENDLVDAMVNLAITSGYEEMPEAAK
jgi:hypothetical protein